MNSDEVELPEYGNLTDLSRVETKLLYSLLLSLGTKLNFRGLVDVFFDGYHINESYFSQGNDLLLNALDELVFFGGTLRLRSVERYFSSLRSACLTASEIVEGHVWINLYLSRTKSTGLGRHVDEHSVFAVQAHGSKTWESWDSQEDSNEPIVLTPGDYIFMPKGVQHLARNQSPLSVHLAVGLPSNFRKSSLPHVKPIFVNALIQLCQDENAFTGLGDSFPLVLGLASAERLIRPDFVIRGSADLMVDSEHRLPSVSLGAMQEKVVRALLNTVRDRSMRVSTFLGAVDSEEPRGLLLQLWYQGMIQVQRPNGSELSLRHALRELHS